MTDLDHPFALRRGGSDDSPQRRGAEAGDAEHEPRRLVASAPRGSALAAALGAARASGPSAEQLRALETRVLAGVGAATIAAASVAAANHGTQTALGLGHAWLAALPGKLAIGLVVAAAGAGGTVVALKRGAETRGHHRVAAVAPRSAPPLAGSSLVERPIARAAPSPAATPEPFAPVRAPSVPPPAAPGAASAPAPGLVPVAPPAFATARSSSLASHATSRARSSSVEELRLLDLAEGALQSDPSLALHLTEQHARRFPSGLLRDEREVIEIAALVRLGRGGAARVQAVAFLRRHPGSAYAPKVRALTNVGD